MLRFSRLRGINQPITRIGKRFFTTSNAYTKDASRFVIDGKAGRVGLWLFIVTSGSFVLGTCGGYTRNMRYGMNTIKWRPSSSIPQNEEDWKKQYEDFKQCPEYTIRGKEVDLETFKQTYWICTVGKFLGAGSAMIFGLPMFYFLYRGYFKGPMKMFCLAYTALYSAIGFQGMYQDNNRPGKVEGEPLPPKDPYMKSLHYLMIYGLYTLGLWQCLNLLRRSPDKVKSIERYFGNLALRKNLMITSKLFLSLTIISGCLMSGTGAGRAIVTFPKVGDKWTITKDDFDTDISIAENFYENKKVLHFTHRNLGMSLFGVLGIQWLYLMKANISPCTRLIFTGLLAAIYGQIYIGAHQITHKMPCEITMLHNLGAYSVVTLYILLLHIVRKPNPAVLKNLATQLQASNPAKYQEVMKKYGTKINKLIS